MYLSQLIWTGVTRQGKRLSSTGQKPSERPHRSCSGQRETTSLMLAVPAKDTSRYSGRLPVFEHASGLECPNSFFLRVTIVLVATKVKLLECGGASQILGWEQSGGESAPAVVGTVTVFGREAVLAPGPGRTVESVGWGGCEGRHKGEERVERSEERVTRFCLSKIGSGTGGTWSGWTPSIRHLSPISTPGR